MVRLGMDVEVVEGVGRKLNRQAANLTSVVAAVDQLIARSASVWDGPRAGQFVDAWRSTHRRALLEVSSSVGGLGASALHNAQEQRTVSGSGSGTTQGGPAAAGFSTESAIDAVHNVGRAFSDAHVSLGIVGASRLVNLGRNANLIGRYSRNSHHMAFAVSRMTGGLIGAGQLHFKQWLNGPFTVNGPLNTIAKSGVFRKLAIGDTLVSIADHTSQVLDSRLSSGDRAGHFIEGTGHAFRLLPGVGTLAGMATSSVNLAFEEARKVDWSGESMSMTFDYLRQNPGEILDSFVDAVPQVLNFNNAERIWLGD